MIRMHSLLFLAISWTGWCFLHSFLISSGFSAVMKRILGRRNGYFRLFYNIFSVLSIIPVIYFQLSLEEKVIFAWNWPWALAKYALYGAALLLFYGGYRVYDIQYMLGIRQIHAMNSGNYKQTEDFTQNGILAYVRHPWYSGSILLIWAFGPLSDVSLISKIVLTLYLITGTLLEERKLIREYGEPYLEYRKRVPMLIPWKGRDNQ